MVEEDQQDRGSRLKVESGEENNKKVERGEKEETVLRNEFKQQTSFLICL